ncbi:hypothetical protein PPTG_21554 [Phytophthora nicotianae INRA-310]|uniref:Uncharacterized protein n=1 Tax=Phytophthora nicotianae (strain INRA-310) TaxID=761204 RepID=W2QZ11_PHYN3|nr:hypothetical protein PPTG_21554 [Phytophthora nicotianae INRA-310]ETN18442.1 hypothetical protein PPTG_21554 [Phytophthora nicotianae INRA-310]
MERLVAPTAPSLTTFAWMAQRYEIEMKAAAEFLSPLDHSTHVLRLQYEMYILDG